MKTTFPNPDAHPLRQLYQRQILNRARLIMAVYKAMDVEDAEIFDDQSWLVSVLTDLRCYAESKRLEFQMAVEDSLDAFDEEVRS